MLKTNVDINVDMVMYGINKEMSVAYYVVVKSDLYHSLPMEATDPAAFGDLKVAQMGVAPVCGAETGAGATAGTENTAVMGVGALAAAGAVAAGAVAYRRRQADQA